MSGWLPWLWVALFWCLWMREARKHSQTRTRLRKECLEAQMHAIQAMRWAREYKALHSQAAVELSRLRWQASAKSPKNIFTDDELRTLIQLCHPDKHNGKQSAIDMTARLNRIRK